MPYFHAKFIDMDEEIMSYLQSLSDNRSDKLQYSLPGNVKVRSFTYRLRSGESLVNEDKKKFLKDELFLELMEARDRFHAGGYLVEIDVTAKFTITPSTKDLNP